MYTTKARMCTQFSVICTTVLFVLSASPVMEKKLLSELTAGDVNWTALSAKFKVIKINNFLKLLTGQS